MALVLASSIPSGSAQVVDLRHRICTLFSPPSPFLVFPGAVSLRHSSALGPCHGHLIYFCLGFSDPQGRPSQFANPFELTYPDASVAVEAFREFCHSRADLSWFFRPLCGKELVFDCSHPHTCHGSVLMDLMHECFTCSRFLLILGLEGRFLLRRLLSLSFPSRLGVWPVGRSARSPCVRLSRILVGRVGQASSQQYMTSLS